MPLVVTEVCRWYNYIGKCLRRAEIDPLPWAADRVYAGLPPFWEQRVEGGKAVFHNTITCSSQPCRPASVHGGILSDDMGLVSGDR